MQGLARRIVPVTVVFFVHAALLIGLQSLKPKAPPAPEDEALPVVWIDRKPAPLAPMAAPGAGLALPAPSLAITPPDIALSPAPATAPPLALDAYVACGLGQGLTDEDRARCDRMRSELFARPDRPVSPDYDLALEQRFSRDKAIQDHPLLRVCYRRMGPDPVCFSRGYEVMYGAAARDSIPLPIGDPIRPR